MLTKCTKKSQDRAPPAIQVINIRIAPIKIAGTITHWQHFYRWCIYHARNLEETISNECIRSKWEAIYEFIADLLTITEFSHSESLNAGDISCAIKLMVQSPSMNIKVTSRCTMNFWRNHVTLFTNRTACYTNTIGWDYFSRISRRAAEEISLCWSSYDANRHRQRRSPVK